MKSVPCVVVFAMLLTACNVVPYVPQQLTEPPIIPPPIERPDLTLPRPDEQVGVPQHSDTLPEVTATLRTCRRDDECVKVKADCCGCNAGGTAVAINNERIQNWQSTLDQKCREIACPQVMSNHWTCVVEPKCVQNKCTLVKP